MNKIKPFDDSNEVPTGLLLQSISDDLFQPIGIYDGNTKEISILLDFGCSVAVTPYKEDFLG